MTPDQIARLLVAQLDELSPADRTEHRCVHGSPIRTYVKEIAERAVQRAYELAREVHPGGLAGNCRYSFNVEREGIGWQVVAVVVRIP